MDDDRWDLTEDDLKNGEWYRWDRQTAEDHPDVAQAVAEFEAHSKNELAAAAATAWLRNEAIGEAACVTRLLVVKGRVVAFYAMASGEARLTSGKKLQRMGITAGARLSTSHLEWIGRDHRAPPGAGQLAVMHAISVAKKVADLQGNRALTLDPFDEETQKMWEQQGFQRTQTELDDGLRRLYIPLFGPYYGRMERGS